MTQATPGIRHGAAELRHIALGFQRPLPRTAFGQLGSTLPPLVGLIATMHAGLANGWWWLVPLLMLPAARLTVRTFIIQHDCGRGSFFASIYRMRVLENGPDRVTVAVENVTAVRFLLVPLFAPGGMRCTSYLERLSPGVWGYYALWGIRAGAQTSGHEASSVNRALAFYRHVAGIPTDQEPPAARR